jgi:uncharacterized protein (DUF2147 family)
MLARILVRGLVCVALMAGLQPLAGMAQATPADAATPVGRWRTVDDTTKKPKSMVTLWMTDGRLFGRIDTLLDPDPKNPEHKCLLCPGEFKDKPFVGLQFVWGLKSLDGEWSGGYILDPDNGKIYKCLIAVEDGGKRLKVRGYIGIPLLGRSQYWYREP